MYLYPSILTSDWRTQCRSIVRNHHHISYQIYNEAPKHPPVRQKVAAIWLIIKWLFARALFAPRPVHHFEKVIWLPRYSSSKQDLYRRAPRRITPLRNQPLQISVARKWKEHRIRKLWLQPINKQTTFINPANTERTVQSLGNVSDPGRQESILPSENNSITPENNSITVSQPGSHGDFFGEPWHMGKSSERLEKPGRSRWRNAVDALLVGAIKRYAYFLLELRNKHK